MTAIEIGRLEVIEKEIHQGLVRLSLGLAEIRDKKLYLRDYNTFEAYCQGRWGWTRQRAYQLIESGEIIGKLKEECQPQVDTEKAARALGRVPEADREAVLEAAEKKNGKTTGPAIEKAAEKLAARGIAEEVAAKTGFKPPKAPDPVEAVRLDTVGREIPKAIIADWDRAEAVGKELRGMASKIKCAVEKGIKDQDLVFGELTNPLVIDCSAVHYSLSQILPYAVCTTCQGVTRSKCTFCRKRGFISKFAWDSFVPSDMKKLLLRKK